MHRIGNVLHVSNTKNIILKAKNVPRIGDKVINEKLKALGTVFDVFGPTSAPYVAVKPYKQNQQQIENQILYSDHSKDGRKTRRNWKKK